ncbi:MAG: arsenite oxidase small subunit [bacterium]|jgi:arsenite oxidase small subunit
MKTEIQKMKTDEEHDSCMLNRRQFLQAGAATVVTTTVMVNLGAGSALAEIPATVTKYPKKKIGSLSDLKNDIPVAFSYPDNGANSSSMLVKLGVQGGGGIGKGKDIVAFNTVCTHQGMLLTKYKKEHKALGACPLHLSTYDLTRHGIVISGQAYQSLPQVLLEVQGNDIYAVGIMGLIFGRTNNLHKG